jgi:peroxiredoxin
MVRGEEAVMTKGMKTPLVFFVAVAIFLLVPNYADPALNQPPIIGERLQHFELLIPQDSKAKSYLGLSGTGRFSVSQIKAQAVIIQIFSMYCPICQADAARVNELYRLIQDNKNLKNKIKMLGIGTGNTAFEVDFFRKKYEVPFPLFPDPDQSLHTILGELRTPYFIGVSIKKDGSNEVFYSELGQFEDAKKFLKVMLERSGL